MKTVLVVDTRARARRVLSRLVAAHYAVRTAGTAEEALAHIESPNGSPPPDLVLMDVSAPGNHDIPELVTELRDREIPVVFLSCEEDQEQPVTAYAEDLITRPFDLAELLNRIRRILDRPAREDPELTPRQIEILTMLAHGASDFEIAQALGLSERTVKWHIQRAGQRLDTNSRAHMVSVALLRGLLPRYGAGSL